MRFCFVFKENITLDLSPSTTCMTPTNLHLSITDAEMCNCYQKWQSFHFYFILASSHPLPLDLLILTLFQTIRSTESESEWEGWDEEANRNWDYHVTPPSQSDLDEAKMRQRILKGSHFYLISKWGGRNEAKMRQKWLSYLYLSSHILASSRSEAEELGQMRQRWCQHEEVKMRQRPCHLSHLCLLISGSFWHHLDQRQRNWSNEAEMT